jgi:hypothetical protein
VQQGLRENIFCKESSFEGKAASGKSVMIGATKLLSAGGNHVICTAI